MSAPEMKKYPSYSTFVERHPAGSDLAHVLAFWESESVAVAHSEGDNWTSKRHSLVNLKDLSKEHLELLGAMKSVRAPFHEL